MRKFLVHLPGDDVSVSAEDVETNDDSGELCFYVEREDENDDDLSVRHFVAAFARGEWKWFEELSGPGTEDKVKVTYE